MKSCFTGLLNSVQALRLGCFTVMSMDVVDLHGTRHVGETEPRQVRLLDCRAPSARSQDNYMQPNKHKAPEGPE